MGASVQKEKLSKHYFEGIEFHDPNTHHNPQQVSQNQTKTQAYLRQDSRKSFVETPRESSKKNVINGQDNNKNLLESQKKKDAGNKFYEQKLYDKAIDQYTAAIKLFDKESLYFSNRAVAYKALGKVGQAVRDCEAAIQLSDSNVRAISLYGAAMIMKSKFTEKKQLDEQSIKLTISGIKYMDDAHHLMVTQVEKSKEKLKQSNKLNLLKGRRVLFLQAQQLDEMNCESVIQLIQMLVNRSNNKIKINMSDLRRFVDQNVLQDVVVPDYYICVITQEIMNEPLMTQSGHSYDQDALVTQFKTNGCVDPSTRQMIDPKLIVRNTGLKMGIIDIKNRNGWLGGEQSEEKDYSRINLE